MSDALAGLLRAALPGAVVTPLPPLLGSENRHAEARRPGEPPLFVKVYRDAEKCRVERVVLAALGERYDWPVLPVAGGLTWQAFPLLSLEEVAATPEMLREWGVRLAEVHRCPPPDGMENNGRAVEQVDRRLERLRSCDLPDVADAAERLWADARDTVGAAALAHHTPPVLLTNDFGFRNTRRNRGVLTLFDFERAGFGDPHWDLGKAWGRELSDPAARAAFLDAYRWVVDQPTMWVTRYVAALAAIPFALRVEDPGFLRESVAMFDVLRSEL